MLKWVAIYFVSDFPLASLFFVLAFNVFHLYPPFPFYYISLTWFSHLTQLVEHHREWKTSIETTHKRSRAQIWCFDCTAVIDNEIGYFIYCYGWMKDIDDIFWIISIFHIWTVWYIQFWNNLHRKTKHYFSFYCQTTKPLLLFHYSNTDR